MVAPGRPILVPAFAVVPHEPLHTFHPLWPVRRYPHLRISVRGPGPSGTSTHLTRQLPGTHFAPIRLLAPLRSDLRLRLYPPLPLGASGRALRCLFLALSSASVARFRPYLPDGRYQASLGH